MPLPSNFLGTTIGCTVASRCTAAHFEKNQGADAGKQKNQKAKDEDHAHR
jgi:hypothetical protein